MKNIITPTVLLSALFLFFTKPFEKNSTDVIYVPIANSAVNNIQMPIEVLGEEGTIVTRTITIDNQTLNNTSKLWLMINNLSYENKGSIKINNESWIPLNHTTAEVHQKELAYGGMVYAGFNTIRLTLPSTGLQEGANTIQFRFDTSDAISIGYRVIKMNLIDANDTELLPENSFVEDDPNNWTAPTNSSVQNGENLWYNKDLWNHYTLANDTGFWYSKTIPNRRTIRAKCTDCHTQDGRDLEMFSYSNLSIIERSKFHGMTEQEGKDIAAYIRSLSSDPKIGRYGRPWNPPYQPGPILENRPIEQWAAGAGLEWVLENDADMAPYIFTSGTSLEGIKDVFDSDKMDDRTIIPIAIQLPDWKHWLPIVHPKDAYTKNEWWNNTLPDAQNPILTYEAVRAKFVNNYDPSNIQSFNVPQRLRELGRGLDGQNGFRHFYQHGSSQTKHWRSENGDADTNLTDGIDLEMAKTSMARLQAVKYFELVNEFDLQDKAPQTVPNATEDQPLDRQWPAKWYSVFEVPAHFTSTKKSGSHRHFTGQPFVTGVFETTAWYQLQFIVNGGNGFVGGTTPTDFNYHHPFMGFTAYHSGISEPLRYFSGINHMYQIRTWSGNNGPSNEGFRIRNQGIWEMVGISNSNQQFWNPTHDIVKQLDQIEAGLSDKVLEAMLLQFITEAEKYDLSTWPRSTHGGDYQLDAASKTTADLITIPYDTDPEAGRVTEHHADKFYDLIPRIQDQFNIDCEILNRITNWCKAAWPLIDFEKYIDSECNNCNAVTIEAQTIYKIKTKNDKYIGTREGSNNITQWDDNGTDHQRWALEPATNDYFYIKNLATQKYLHSPSNTDNGLNVQQRDFDGSDRQQWEITTLNDCKFSITSKHTGKCVDLKDGASADGTLMQQWDCEVINDDQSFSFESDGNILGIEDLAMINILLYPNPTKAILNIKIAKDDLDSTSEIRIYDFMGKVVKKATITESLLQINLENLASGSYFFKIINNKKSYHKIFIKE